MLRFSIHVLPEPLPPHLTAMTAMDAMTHAVEAYTCMAHNPISDAYATAAIKKVSNHLFNVLDNRRTIQTAALQLAQASTMAGTAFSNSMVGLVHSLGHALGAVAHFPAWTMHEPVSSLMSLNLTRK